MLTQEQFERRVAMEAAKPKMEAKQEKKLNRKDSRRNKKEEKLAAKEAKMQEKHAKAAKRQAKLDAGETVEDDMISEDEDGEWLDEEDMDEEVEIITGHSLFDEEILEDWPTILRYMEKKFGFVIPHLSRVKDMEMLCTYLQIKINHCCRCLYTSKRFRSPEAAKDYMAAKGNRRFNSETFEDEFGKFYHPLGDTKKAEKERLQIVQNGAWGKSGEEGVTASGKVLVPRELAWVARQTPKPEESHVGVLAAREEAEERAVNHFYDMMKFKRSIKSSEMTRQDVHRQSKHMMRLQVKGNALNPIPFECMMFGR